MGDKNVLYQAQAGQLSSWTSYCKWREKEESQEAINKSLSMFFGLATAYY